VSFFVILLQCLDAMKFFERIAPKQPEKECIDCDKKTQKDLPPISTSGDGMRCERIYTSMTECMAKHDGQISPCVKEWDAFRQCHNDETSGEGKWGFMPIPLRSVWCHLHTIHTTCMVGTELTGVELISRTVLLYCVVLGDEMRRDKNDWDIVLKWDTTLLEN